MFPVSYVGADCSITLPNVVGIANVRELVKAVRNELTAGRRRIVLDLSQSDAIDSTALGALVQLFKAATAQTSELRLLAPRSGVRRVLAITRLDQVFSIDDDVSSAAIAPAA